MKGWGGGFRFLSSLIIPVSPVFPHCVRLKSSGLVLTSKVILEVHEGNVLPRLLPLDARLLVHLGVEYAGQHCV